MNAKLEKRILGRDGALRRPRRRAQRQATENERSKCLSYHDRSALRFAPGGAAAARQPYQPHLEAGFNPKPVGNRVFWLNDCFIGGFTRNCGQSDANCGQFHCKCGRSDVKCGQSDINCGQSEGNCERFDTDCVQPDGNCDESDCSGGRPVRVCGRLARNFSWDYLVHKQSRWGASLRARRRLAPHAFGGQRTARPTRFASFVCQPDNPNFSRFTHSTTHFSPKKGLPHETVH